MKTIQLKNKHYVRLVYSKSYPVLNETVGEGNWRVDTQNPKKVLTVHIEDLDESEIIKAAEKAGYKAEQL